MNGHAHDFVDDLQVAAPCTVPWEGMAGDDRSRFCTSCELHVHNVSEMTREEADALIRETEGRICVRMLRRFDGTVVTRDCPRGLAALRRRARLARARVAAALAVLWMGAGACSPDPAPPSPTPHGIGCGTGTSSPGLLGRAWIAVKALFAEPQVEIQGSVVPLPPPPATPETPGNPPDDPSTGR